MDLESPVLLIPSHRMNARHQDTLPAKSLEPSQRITQCDHDDQSHESVKNLYSYPGEKSHGFSITRDVQDASYADFNTESRVIPDRGKCPYLGALNRSQTPGEATASLPMEKLSLGAKLEPQGASVTFPGRKRAATSTIQHRDENDCQRRLTGADNSCQPKPDCVKRVACGEQSPFPPNSERSLSLATSAKQVGADSARQGQVSQLQRQNAVVSHPDVNPLVAEESNSLAKRKYPGILSQPESRPLTSDQLAVEVKNIYSKLVAVEAKCISLDNTELANNYEYIETQDRDKWQAMMALHRTLLYEHHDFLLASQHPAAGHPLKRLALKYSMPARMWKHGIHSFLEVLRRRLPASMDYMLQFIYTAYQMIALLYETVGGFKATWIECLGDLARYRMAIEDGVQRDRETWGSVARSWYSTASDMNPQTGRLYHHLGILARPNAVQQLCYYSRALTCIEPFSNARESLSTLLASAIESRKAGRAMPYVDDIDTLLLYLHAVMFMDIHKGAFENVPETFQDAKAKYILGLSDQMDSHGATWKTHGVYIAISNITACFGYGSEQSNNLLMLAFENWAEGPVGLIAAREGDIFKQKSSEELKGDNLRTDGISSKEPSCPVRLLFAVFAVALRRENDYGVLPHVHVLLVFIRSVAFAAAKTCPFLSSFLQLVPWLDLVAFLNGFKKAESTKSTVVDNGPMVGSKGNVAPLPEDYSLRGEVWVKGYFSEGWFRESPDEDTRYLEQASTDKTRVQRVLWLGMCISKYVSYIDFDARTMAFSANMGPQVPSPSVSPDKVHMLNATKCQSRGMIA